MNPFYRKKPTPLEQAKLAQRETKTNVRSNQRQIERDIRDLDRQEKALIQQIKLRARNTTTTSSISPHKDPALRAQSRQLVQIRHQKAKMYETKARLSSVGMQATAMASQVSMATAMGNVTSAISNANTAMDVKQLGKTMAEFSKQSETAKMKEELMNDALAEAFDESDVEAEAEDVTNQILAELGVELDTKMVGLNAPSNKLLTSTIQNENKEQDMTKEEQDALLDLLPELKARLDAFD